MVSWTAADWRSANAYAVLTQCDRHAFAWEWLRRQRRYREAWARAQHRSADAMVFGLLRFEPPDRPVPDARPIWAYEADRYVLPAIAAAGDHGEEAFDIEPVADLAECHITADGCEHWQFSDGRRQIRLDLLDGTLRAGPALLHYAISGLQSAEPKAVTLDRLILLARHCRLAATRFPSERRAPRWALILRVYDALVAGASHRDIASELFNLGNLARWRVDASSYRRRVQRLVAAARDAINHDPREWLNGRYP